MTKIMTSQLKQPLTKEKSISEGYSNLFKKISCDLNLIVVKILGHSKGLDFQLTDKFRVNENHVMECDTNK